MSEQAEAHLREEVRKLASRAAPHIIATPLTARSPSAPPAEETENISGLINELAGGESELSSHAAEDDALLGKARATLGALYASRYIRGGWAQADKQEGLRLLRAARARGYLKADSDPDAMLLLAVLLMPVNLAHGGLQSLEALNWVLTFSQQLASGGPAVDDLRELRILLGEIVAVRPDDPRIGPLVQFTEMLNQTLGVLQDVSSGADISDRRLDTLTAALAPDPSNRAGMMINALMGLARGLKAAPAAQQSLPAAQPAEELGSGPNPGLGLGLDDPSTRNKLALFLAASVPDTLTTDEMPRLIKQVESGGDVAGPAIAALGQFVQAVRTNDPRDLDQTVQNLRAVVEAPPSASMAWMVRMIFPAVLTAASMAHGNRQDDAKAAEQLDLDWSSLSPDGVFPAMDEPGIQGLSIGRLALGSHLQLAQAREEEDDDALENLIATLTEAKQATDPASEWFFLIPFQRSIAELSLGLRRQDAELLDRASRDLHAAFGGQVPAAVRPLMEAAQPMVHMALAVLDRQPVELSAAVTRARASLQQAPVAHDQHTLTRLSIAMALKARHALTQAPGRSAALQEAIEELEQARSELTERSGSTVTSDVLWQLAEAYRLRGDEGTDDDSRAVALALDSLRVVAEDVLLQLGTEHGLSAAKAGAGRGLRAAGWALASGHVEQAVDCLERGRALVLRAAATARSVPDRLRAASAHALADQWEQSTSPSPLSATPSADRSAPLIFPGDDYVSVPSDLRRRALEVLRRNEDSAQSSSANSQADRPLDQAADSYVARIARELDQAGIDALVYLVPETDTEGRAVVVRRDGAVRDLPLAGLAAAGRGAFENYLDTAMLRSAHIRQVRQVRQGPGEGTSRDLSAVTGWTDSLDELCAWAGTAVVDKLVDALPCDPTRDAPARVVLVPCGVLGLVPWHAAKLSREPADAGLTRPLRACDLLVISYAASAGELLQALTRERVSYRTNPVIVVDPSRTLRYAETEAIAIRSAYLEGARFLGFVKGHQVAEAGTPGDVLALLTGRDGTAPASMLQITAHGTAGTRPTASRLLLAGSAAEASDEGSTSVDCLDSGYLTVAEILDAPGPSMGGRIASLVVLDCCDTDLSNRDHDEALTLTTAFVARGATDAIGSRWSIDDWSAAVCMVVFHHYLAKRKLAPADALRAAQLWMLGPDREQIPGLTRDLLEREYSPLHAVSAWAPFIHQGNARPRDVAVSEES
ncbi:MAG TPA: CHAT domain-containing protein [Actinocrinis sp.]|nr:CHAT domain-containing protein [Actinocrinis sp.]